MYADIIVDISRGEVDKTFQYRVPEDLAASLRPGSKVRIPFHNRRDVGGYVVALSDTAKIDESKIKDILGLAKKSVDLDDRMIALAAWMKESYGCTFNQALKTVLPAKAAVKKGRTKVESVPLPTAADLSAAERQPVPVLNEEQKAAVRAILKERQSANRPSLIFGVTGSGKTEVYMDLIARCIKAGGQAILLIPEISLTYQNLRRFFLRFGDRIGVINSRQSAGEKYETVQKARKGELDLVIGPRSALFTPFPKLGLIIIDEEHEGAYHSDQTPRYNAGEVAEQLAKLSGATLVLGSATPSLESFYRCETGAYQLIRLTHRAVKSAAMPEVHLVDLRTELEEGNKSVFSRLLSEKISERLEKKEQVMLFLNRRGYAGFVSCRSCGKPLKCPHCSVSLTFHRGGMLKCHYCGYSVPFPDKCPACGSPYVAAFGTGTQKVESIVEKAFPGARVLRMDADTTAGKSGHSRILSAFSHEEADILIGTQMIVKGHDFPKVTLVGVLAADISLYAPDFKAAERTFELLTQASGRAGRGQLPGEVVIQTYMPEHYAVTAAAAADYEAFYREEMAFRKLLHYPPAGGLLTALILGQEESFTAAKAEAFKNAVLERFGAEHPAVIGPAEGPVQKLQDVYRRQIMIKHPDREVLRRIRDFGESLLGENAQFDIR